MLHYSYRTEQAYLQWIIRFIRFHGRRHPAEMGAAEVEAFLNDLAVCRHVSASTQNQAKAAILFLYREVLAVHLPWLENVTQAKTAARLPTVLTQREARQLLDHLNGTHWLIASLFYGSGLRLIEALRLRVKDVEFTRREILVSAGKGNKDCVRRPKPSGALTTSPTLPYAPPMPAHRATHPALPHTASPLGGVMPCHTHSPFADPSRWRPG